MELFLIRHARAAERGARYPDDTERPLVAKGEAQARLLAAAFERLGVRFERVTTSPWLRARQTAEPLRALSGGGVVVLDALSQGDPNETALALRGLLAEARSLPGAGVHAGRQSAAAATATAARIAAVGHEPWLSMLAAWLLSGSASGLAIAFRKAAVMTLEGDLRAGGMTLTGFLPMRSVKALSGAVGDGS